MWQRRSGPSPDPMRFSLLRSFPRAAASARHRRRSCPGGYHDAGGSRGRGETQGAVRRVVRIGHTLSGQEELSWDSPVQPAWRSFLYHLHSPVTGLAACARDSVAICGGVRPVEIDCRQIGLRRPWDNRRRSTRLRFRPGSPDRRWWPASCTPHRRRFSAWCCARSCPIASWAGVARRLRS